MARGIYPHELSDPDFQWLIKNYCETSAPVAVVDAGCLPLVMVILDENARALVNQDILSHSIFSAMSGPQGDAPVFDEPKE
jgi:hypothetical protein